jgi:Secretion system C-terminal sorting domain
MIMKKILILILLVSTSSPIFSQNLDFGWAKRTGAGGVNNDYGYGTVTDNSSNVYTVGSFSATTDFDPGPGTFTLTNGGSNDCFIQKLDKFGNLVWAKHIAGSFEESGYAIDIAANGNIYITGIFQGTVDFDPGPGVTTLPYNAQYDIFILCLNSSGDFQWAKSFGGSVIEIPTSINVDNNNDVVVTGYFAGTVDFDPGAGTNNITSNGGDDSFISKFSGTGTYQWTQRIGSAFDEYIYDVTTSELNAIVCTGVFTGTVDFDPSGTVNNLTATNMNDAFVLALSSTGSYGWSAKLGGSGNETGYGITMDNLYNIYVTGFFSTSMDADPGAGSFNLTSNGANDIFVVKLAGISTFQWAIGLGGTANDNGRDIMVNANGDVYTCGYYRNTVDFDPGAGVASYTSNGSGDMFLHAVDNNGNFLWAKTVGGTGDDIVRSLSISPTQSTYLTGYFTGTVDFDPTSAVSNVTSAGSNDFYVHKYCKSSSSINSISACYSYVSPSGNYTWSSNGTYQDTIANHEGCDSILTINLTLNGTTTSTYTVEACNQYISPSGNYTWHLAGAYNDTISNVNGCDSVITINLTFTQPDTTVTLNNGMFTVAQTGATYQWLDCNTQVNISGGTNQSFMPSLNGSYAVIVNLNGCPDTSSCFMINDVGLEQINENFIQLYPNPAHDYLQLNNFNSIIKWEIFDLSGKVVGNSSTGNIQVGMIPISNLKNGYYLLHVETTVGISTHKFIKQ